MTPQPSQRLTKHHAREWIRQQARNHSRSHYTLAFIPLLAIAAGVPAFEHVASAQRHMPALKAAAEVAARHSLAVSAGQRQGTLIRTLGRSGGMLAVLRTKDGNLLNVQLGPSDSVSTFDGHALAASNMQLGDRIKLLPENRIVDTSQVWTSVKGIVATPADDANSPITIQIAPSNAVIISVDQHTVVQRTKSSDTVQTISDGDQVTAQVALDVPLGEMTETDTISAQAPR